MQKHHEYYTSTQYYAKDSTPDDEYFVMPRIVSQAPHASVNAPTAYHGLKSDSMYGSDKYEDHHQTNFHSMNHHHNKGHHRVPEVNKKVHFVEHVEIDKNGKHEVHDEENCVDIEADGFIQKNHQSFDKWETFKRY